MKLAVLVVLLAGWVAVAEAGQAGRPARGATAASSNVAEAYNQYLVGRRLERDDNVDGAIAAFKRASSLDPTAAEPQAELAALYMRQNRVGDADHLGGECAESRRDQSRGPPRARHDLRGRGRNRSSFGARPHVAPR